MKALLWAAALLISTQASAYQDELLETSTLWIKKELQNTSSKSRLYIEKKELELDSEWGGRQGDHDLENIHLAALMEEDVLRPTCTVNQNNQDILDCSNYYSATYLVSVAYHHSFSGGGGTTASTFVINVTRTKTFQQDENGNEMNVSFSVDGEFRRGVEVQTW